AEMLLKSRRNLAVRYDSALKEVPWLITPFVPENQVSGYQSYVCLFSGNEDIGRMTINNIDSLHQKRNKFMSYLEELGIATRQGTHAVHTLGYYRKKYRLHPEHCLKAFIADRLSISLPLYHGLTGEEFQYIIEAIKSYSRRGE
nr:DegT/DnrJ/EryC1/StrS family aminotransferase [Thermotogota bacterium]